MTARLLDGGDDAVCGVLTSGGTESIVLAAKAHRDYYREVWGGRCSRVLDFRGLTTTVGLCECVCCCAQWLLFFLFWRRFLLRFGGGMERIGRGKSWNKSGVLGQERERIGAFFFSCRRLLPGLGFCFTFPALFLS